MPSEFKAGDTVQLKSGGPIMTLKDKAPDGDWIGIWFDGAELKQGVFPPATIKAYDSPITRPTFGTID